MLRFIRLSSSVVLLALCAQAPGKESATIESVLERYSQTMAKQQRCIVKYKTKTNYNNYLPGRSIGRSYRVCEGELRINEQRINSMVTRWGTMPYAIDKKHAQFDINLIDGDKSIYYTGKRARQRGPFPYGVGSIDKNHKKRRASDFGDAENAWIAGYFYEHKRVDEILSECETKSLREVRTSKGELK